MMTVLPATFFASPERAPLATVDRQRRTLLHDPAVGSLLDSFPGPAAIINPQRQVVCANAKLAALVDRSELSLVGLRFGEAMNCECSRNDPAGCGTTPGCALCGAAKAIATTQTAGVAATEDCRMTLNDSANRESLDLRVWTTPFAYEGERYTVVAAQDTADEQRRRVLERMFFHDVLNAAGSLRFLLQAWPELDCHDAAVLASRVAPLAVQVVEEIESQRDLTAAEHGELIARRETVAVTEILDQVGTLYRSHPVAEGKSLLVSCATDPAPIVSDAVLLRRVLGNLVKNALEASGAGQRVAIRYECVGEPRFAVHNQGAMPQSVKLQVFKRSFSTKGGHGRGVGTYSARLLAERYLGGRLTFTSNEDEGTTFVLELPQGEATRITITSSN